jgi:putative endopeptidase
MRKFVFLLVAALSSGFSLPGQAVTTPPTPQAVTQLAGLHLDWMDLTENPGKNFYAYANGGWIKAHPIPDTYPEWSMFAELERNNQLIIKKILEQAASSQPPAGTIEQKVGDFYFSGMNTARINTEAAHPLLPEFTEIYQIKNRADFQQALTHLQMMGVNVLFNFGQMQDFKDSSKVIATVGQGGLGLPDRDYYLGNNAKFRAVRKQYVQHMVRMFELLGDKPVAALLAARTVMTIETSLAKSFLPPVALRDPHAVYHIYNLQALNKLAPCIDWQAYLSAIHHPEIQSVNVVTERYFHVLNDDLQKIPLANWKVYLRWHLIQTFAPYLSAPFVNESFTMTTAITGTKKLLPRWQRVVAVEDDALGFAVGKLFVAQTFSPASKVAVQEMVENIKRVMQADLQHLSWMSPATRAAALKKLAAMEARVGYPDQWRDYAGLRIDRGPYVLNIIRAYQFLAQRELNKIGKPVDKNEWFMTPQTVDAYYDPSMNRLNIPAGILQPPFYDVKASAALNYGAIGFVIGHEMTHGFDDEGAQFDGQGNLKNWWSKADYQRFNKLTENIVQQYSGYQVLEGLHLQGRLVVGEAAADLGGMTLAYKAFHAAPDYQTAPVIKGFTPDQQFFLAAAHVWANNRRPEQARRMVISDPHPAALYRVNGTMADMQQFQAAYNVAPFSPMINQKRSAIW